MLALMFIGFYSGLIYDSMLVLIIGSMIGFILFNLGIFGKKKGGVFLGDSGSNLVGFWVAWLQFMLHKVKFIIEPITILWFVAIPLLDCIGLIFSRTSKR